MECNGEQFGRQQVLQHCEAYGGLSLQGGSAIVIASPPPANNIGIYGAAARLGELSCATGYSDPYWQ